MHFASFIISLNKVNLFKVILVKVAWYFSCTMAMSAGVCNLETINWHRKEDIVSCMIIVFTRVCKLFYTWVWIILKLWSFSTHECEHLKRWFIFPIGFLFPYLQFRDVNRFFQISLQNPNWWLLWWSAENYNNLCRHLDSASVLE